MFISKEAVAFIESGHALEESFLFVSLSAGYSCHCAFLITVPPGILPEIDAPRGDPFVTKRAELLRVSECTCQCGGERAFSLCEQTSNGKQLWLQNMGGPSSKIRKTLSLRERTFPLFHGLSLDVSCSFIFAI